jgi:hypothetical protein
MEDPHRVAAAADARDHDVGLPARGLGHLREALAPITDWKSRTIIG